MKIFNIKGKKYVLKKIIAKDGNYDFKLIPYEKDKFDRKIEYVSKQLAKAINKKTLIKQVLSNLEFSEIEKMEKSLRKGLKPKAKEGCYEIELGNQEIMLVN